ncbi:hypothetical protein TNCV_3956171 [Trichonephila clavipes]|nr:hypothetical protein TNCV_3956171 [Trichonephila clavipes]
MSQENDEIRNLIKSLMDPLTVDVKITSLQDHFLDKMLFEGDARNRWRDGPVCPAVDKELWRLGPDGSGVFWRVMRQ